MELLRFCPGSRRPAVKSNETHSTQHTCAAREGHELWLIAVLMMREEREREREREREEES